MSGMIYSSGTLPETICNVPMPGGKSSILNDASQTLAEYHCSFLRRFSRHISSACLKRPSSSI